MTSPNSALASSPVVLARPLATEVLIHILSFCKTRRSQCAAGELLWTDIVLDHPNQLQRLFQSVSRKHESSVEALSPSVAPYLSLGRISHLTLTSSDLLRTPLVLGSTFRAVLRPKRLILRNIRDLTSTNQSLFGPLRPKELVYVFPHDDFVHFSRPTTPWRRHYSLRTNHVVVVLAAIAPAGRLFPLGQGFGVNEICALFFGTYNLVDLAARLPRHPTSLRFVLLPSACADRDALVGFLATRHRAGALDQLWFQSRPGSVTVEVPTEEAKEAVAEGSAKLLASLRPLVAVEVGSGASWEDTSET